jgi:cytochrome c-type biogenesis protein CcmH/NrfF
MIQWSPAWLGALLAVVALTLFSLSSLAGAQTRASLPDIEDEVMCPICGTLLAESQSPQADRERALIRRLIAEGKDKDQIKDALVAEYGSNVLATPSGSGFDLFAWLVPVVGIALAALLVGRFALSRRHGRQPEMVKELDPAERARLEEDLSRYQP